MKKALLLLIGCIVSTTIFAQSVTVKGKLVSSEDNSALPYATISIARESDPKTPIKKLATDDGGNFTTTLGEGKYVFQFQFVGMNNVDQSVEISSGESTKNLGSIKMTEASTELDELSVVAQRPLVKVEIDKLTYSAKDDPESSTSNVLDLLRKVPMVTVDGEDNIQLKGASNFKIYLNGKPSNMISSNPSQVLKSMPANSIKDVEVITEPGAKYDAEGVGGIINIITDKRVDDGYSGSVGANGDTFGGYGGNAYLTLKYGKFGFSGNGAYFNHRSPESKSSFIREDIAPNPVNRLTQDGTSKSNGGGSYFNTSVSYEPDTLNLFNISASRFGGKFYSNSFQEAISQGARNYSYDNTSKSMSQFGGLNFSADYQRNFKKKGEMFTLSYRFENNPNDSEFESKYDNVIGTFYYDTGYIMKSVNDAGGIEHTFQADYVNPLNAKHTIETGLKYILRDNSSRGVHTYYDVNSSTWKSDLSRKNDLDHNQGIASGYAGYGYKTGKMGFKAGLRGEQTQQRIHYMSAQNDTIVNSSFFDLMPSFTVSYQLGMTKSLRGGYNMRISRPGIWYLNPYINDSNPINISYGNPALESEARHNFNVNYGSFSQKLNFNVSLNYSFTRNSISSYSFIENGVTHNTYANIGRNQSIGLNTYVSWTPSQVVRMNLNGSVDYVDLQSTASQELRNSGFSGRAFSGITFTLPKDTRISLNGGLFSGRIQLQTKQSAFYFYSASVMKSFLDKKLDVSLNASNPFSEYLHFNSTTNGVGFTQKSKFSQPMRNFRLSVTYRFGDLKSSIKRVQRGITNDDVLQGEGNSQGGGAATQGTGG